MSLAQCRQHGDDVLVIWDDRPDDRTLQYRPCPMCAMERRLDAAVFERDMLSDELKEERSK